MTYVRPTLKLLNLKQLGHRKNQVEKLGQKDTLKANEMLAVKRFKDMSLLKKMGPFEQGRQIIGKFHTIRLEIRVLLKFEAGKQVVPSKRL